MNYADTIAYLFSRLPMYQRSGPAAYKAGLGNITALCAALGNPHLRFRSVHIAGTNGKGSVAHALASVLQEAGLKTGLHTSPHLHDFRERIRVNGAPAPEAFVCTFTGRMQDAIGRLNPSFFEISVAMAFEWFAQQAVDVAVIETGLGGRLDSTNIVTPELSVITGISLDHTDLLGDTVEKIASEKAGIIKQNTPAVIGPVGEELKPLFAETAAERKAPLIFADDRYVCAEAAQVDDMLRLTIWRKKKEAGGRDTGEEITLDTDLTGLYQKKNMLTVLSSVDVLRERGWNISSGALRRGLRNVTPNTGLAGRWQVMGRNPLTICDCMHNAEGVREVMEQVKTLTYSRLRVVFGTVSDKDIGGMLDLLPQDAVYYFCRADIPRALDAQQLAGEAAGRGLSGQTFGSVGEAVSAARDSSGPDDIVLIGGSIFVVAEALENDEYRMMSDEKRKKAM